ncbi:MAG: prepilin-type N-terminal cleavage/methylation domain-containing protein [Gemmatimonadaceae bacterium]|nr:prepilin-type N-terminal cleavage/methylation domain-containing protein [Gemmatimonadaceae bacterium]
MESAAVILEAPLRCVPLVRRARVARWRAFTLVELLVSLVLLGVMGAAMLRLFVSQSRFVDQQVKQRAARTVSRVSLNLLLQELRTVEAEGGVVTASQRAIGVRVPYALGITCGTAGGRTIVSLLPVDSVLYAQAVFAGYAYRVQGGDYRYVDVGASTAPSAAVGTCVAAGVTTLPRGQLIQVAPAIPAPYDNGAPVLVFQRIDYDFSGSVVVPGRMALWRSVQGGRHEEVAVPFDSTSAFRFFTVGDDTSLAAPPASLTAIRGVELRFTGASEEARAGRLAPELSPQRSAVFFLNAPEH